MKLFELTTTAQTAEALGVTYCSTQVAGYRGVRHDDCAPRARCRHGSPNGGIGGRSKAEQVNRTAYSPPGPDPRPPRSPAGTALPPPSSTSSGELPHSTSRTYTTSTATSLSSGTARSTAARYSTGPAYVRPPSVPASAIFASTSRPGGTLDPYERAFAGRRVDAAFWSAYCQTCESYPADEFQDADAFPDQPRGAGWPEAN